MVNNRTMKQRLLSNPTIQYTEAYIKVAQKKMGVIIDT